MALARIDPREWMQELDRRLTVLEELPPPESVAAPGSETNNIYVTPEGTTEPAAEGPVYVAGLRCGAPDLFSASANREILQEAIDALYPRGGTIWLPGCDIYFDGSIELTERRSVIFQGQSGLSAGAPAATRLIHSGLIGPPVSPWECLSTFGIVFRDCQILHVSNLAGTHLINMEHGGEREEDAAYNRIERCNLGGVLTNSAFSLLNLDQAISCSVYGTHFGAAQVHVRGITGSGNYSNAHSFHDCTFNEAVVMPVIDPGEGWTFVNPTVEPLATGAAGFISENEDVENVSKGLGVIGGWFGDANGTGDWIRFSGTGFASYGSRVGTGGSWMRLGTKGAVEGLAVVGGHFDSVTNLLVVPSSTYGKSHRSWAVFGNHYINTGGISWGGKTILPQNSIIDNPKDRVYMPGMMTLQGGPVGDAIFPVPPPDGTMAYDTVNHRLYVKSGETWRKSSTFE